MLASNIKSTAVVAIVKKICKSRILGTRKVTNMQPCKVRNQLDVF
jgi:hypothetical protein